MHKGSQKVPLGEVLTQIKEPASIASQDLIRYAGVHWYAEGVYERGTVRAAGVKAKTMQFLSAGDITYNRMWATKGAFGVASSDVEGCMVTNDFPVFRSNGAVLPEFLRLIFQTQGFQEQAASLAVGTTERRRLKERDFLGIEIMLPVHSQQRRIVDLIAAVDHVIEATTEELNTCQALLDAYLRESFSVKSDIVRRLGDLADMRSGPSWQANQESSEPSDDAVPVLKIANTRPDGTIDLTHRSYITGLPPNTTLLSESSLVMIRTNGNRARIGNVYRANKEVIGHAVSAFQIAILPHDPADSEYLFRFLQSGPVQAAISAEASGSTGLGNIAIKWLRELELPWFSEDERRSIVEIAAGITEVIYRAQVDARAARHARAMLLSDLLHGEYEIPDAYDELLERTG